MIDATTGAVITHTSAEGFIPGVLRGLNRMRQTEQAKAQVWAATRAAKAAQDLGRQLSARSVTIDDR